jgi:hypothetical protein
MLKKLTLALTASLLLSAQATAQEKKQPPTAPPMLRTLAAVALGSTASWVAPISGFTLARGI